jgi:hypothetical protein
MPTADEVERSRDNEERKVLGWLYDISDPQNVGEHNLNSCGLSFKILEPTFSTTLAGNRESNPDAFIESSSPDRPNLVMEVKLGIFTEAELHKQFNEHVNIAPGNFRTCATTAYDLVYLAKPSIIQQIGMSLAPKIASSSGRRIVLWRLDAGRIELADSSKPNHSDAQLNTLLSQGITISRQPKTPILFLKRSPINLKAQAILTSLFMRGIATKIGDFTVSDIRSAVFPIQLDFQEIMTILRYCKEGDLINWNGREDFSLSVAYGNTTSVSTFFQHLQELETQAKSKRVSAKQTGIDDARYLRGFPLP